MKKYLVVKGFSNERLGQFIPGEFLTESQLDYLKACEKCNIKTFNYDYKSPFDYGLIFESKTYPFISTAKEESRCELEERMENEMIKCCNGGNKF